MKKIKKKIIWGFVPARSGSKSIKNKNIIIYKKKPLLVHSLNILRNIKLIDKVYLSSDTKKYNKIASKYEKFNFHLRPKKFSSDNSTDFELLYDFLINLETVYLPEYVVYLRPTSPNRSKKIVNYAIKAFLKKKNFYSSLRSVSPMPNPSYKTFRIVDKKLCSLFKKDFNLDKFNRPRQLFEKTFLPNGYIDIIKTENILKKNKFHGSKVMPFIIDDFVLDIDELSDLKK